MKRSIRSLKRRLEIAVGDTTDAWLTTVIIDYEGQVDFDAPEWLEIWFDDGLTVYRNYFSGDLAAAVQHRRPLTAEQKVWL